MASLSLKHIYKVYEGTTRAVNDFNMEIRDREFIVFVGPSGCGKSTTLRMIAGLEEISAGELRIDGVVVNDMEPRDRNIAMVFQNYALYPHMTVYENMAFSLKTAHVPREEIRQKVTEAARILGITEYLERKPRALSGGQRQRVALGRAIVRNPKVFLFDEPLSNLDAKLRAAMRAEIIRLYERLGTTFIYVTHDQVEAMTMGSRIVVMRGGFVQQIDTPRNLYDHPENMFVASFIGTPRMNFWDATLEREGERVRVSLPADVSVTVPRSLLFRVQSRYMDGQYPLVLGVRPDDLRLWEEGLDPTTWQKIPVTVSVVEVLGGESLIYGRLGADTPDAPTDELSDGDREVILKAPADCHAARGDVIDAAIHLGKLHVFDRESQISLKRRVPEENVAPCTVDTTTLTFAGQRLPLPPVLSRLMEEKEKKAPLAGELFLPSDAILLGTGAGRARVSATETITDTRDISTLLLYQLDVNGEVFFASERGEARFSAGDTVPFDLNFSRITVEKAGIHPLPRENELDGRFTKEKVLDERPDSPTKGRKIHRFFLEMADMPVEADEALREKLFSCKGSAVFHLSLSYRFPVDGVRVLPRREGSREGISGIFGRVSAILDYGRTTYASITVGTRQVIAPYEGAVGDPVILQIDQSRLTVSDRESGLILA